MDREKLLSVLGELPLEALANPRPSNVLEFSRKWKAILEESGSSPKVEEIIKLLKSSSELKIYDGTMLNMGSGAMRIEYRNLANWLIWRAAHTSPDKAVEDLETSLERDWSEAWDVLILNSLETPQTFEIAENIFIMPLADVPDSLWKFEMEKEARAWPSVPGSITPARCALGRRRAVAPRFWDSSKIDEGTQHGVAHDSPLFDLARRITLIRDACPLPYMEYTQLCDHVPCAQFTGWGAGSPRYDVVYGPSFKLTEDIVPEVIENFARFRSVPPKDKPFFGMVLDRLNQAKRRYSLADRAIDLGMALEVLLLRNDRPQTQLQMTVRYRGAWLLGKDVPGRKDIYRQLGKVYKHRSAAVHRGQLTPGSPSKRQKLEQDIENGISLCIDAIKELMEIGYPTDWNDIVLGVDQ